MGAKSRCPKRMVFPATPHPLSLPHSPAPPPAASHMDNDDADVFLGLPEALFSHYAKSKGNMGDG